MAGTLKAITFGGRTPAHFPSDVALTLLRVAAGIMMATHGWGKIPVSREFVENVGNMGFPLPALFAWSAALSEFAGGILLAAGFLTRISAFMIAGTMIVAAFIVHAGDPLSARELALLYLAIMVVFMTTGCGRFGVDALLRRA